MIKPAFSQADEFQNGIARVKVDDKIGYIDANGSYIWKPSC